MTDAKSAAPTLPDILFAQSANGLCLVAPDGTVVRANPEWLRSTGLAEGQVIGENIIDLIPGTREMALAMRARALAGHRVEVPRHAQVVNGRETWWEGSIEPIPMEGGTGLLVTSRAARDAPVALDGGDALPVDEATLRGILNATRESIWLFSADGVALAANETALARWRRPPGEILGRSIVEFTPSPLGEARLAQIREVVRCGQTLDFEDEREGIHFEHMLYPVLGEGGRVERVAVFSRDVTQRLKERRLAEEALRQSEERLRALADNFPDGAVYRYQHDDSERPRFLHLSRGIERLTGIPPEEVLLDASVLLDTIVPEDRPRLAQAEARSREALAPFELEVRERHRVTGEERWALLRSLPTRLSSGATVWDGIHIDITTRKRAEEALRVSEKEARERAAELEAVLNCIADGVIVYDREGRTVRSNPAADEILKIPTGDRSAPFHERVTRQYEVRSEDGRLVPPDEMITFRASVLGEEAKRVIRRVQPQGQPPHWLMMSAKPLLIAGKHQGAVLSMTDFTERKAAEEALREADRRKDEFLGMLSHELRNPLAPIRNSTYILQHADPGSEQARRAQEVIRRQTEHLTRLVDDLLDVTRIARGKIQLRRSRVDLREVVWRAADDFHLLMADRGVKFSTALPEQQVWADADGTRVTQIVGNLLHNAAKFTRKGDEVTLTLETDARKAIIRVRDTGAGMAPELLPRIFDMFFQGERTLARTDGGLGLGLALVKGITELHGGTVGADSAGKGKGSEFTVRLPLMAALASDVPAEPRGDRRKAGRRVLVVDDNTDAAESLADLVRMLGHSVEVAYDGPTAIEKVRANAPNVVLCDIGLPGMSGYEVAQALRANAVESVQLIAVSGYAQPEDVKRAIEAGFDGHLAKPCDPAMIERLLS